MLQECSIPLGAATTKEATEARAKRASLENMVINGKSFMRFWFSSLLGKDEVGYSTGELGLTQGGSL